MQIEIESDPIECESEYEIASGSLWRDGRLYIHDGEAQPTQQSRSFEERESSDVTTGFYHAKPDSLQDLLFGALKSPDHPERKRFFPKTTFTEIVNEHAVQDELRHCCRGLGPIAIGALARTICGAVSFRKIFALLVLVERVADIQIFLREGVADDDLPLQKISQPGSTVFRLGRCTSPQVTAQPLHCFDGWNTSVMWMFEDWQWATLAPIFHGGERKNVSHVDLKDRDPLPFLSDSRYDLGSEIIRGGFSTVFKVDIHPDHHTFRAFKVGLPDITSCAQ